jgi:glycosyltransferase involved in cell wall biosynthesis
MTPLITVGINVYNGMPWLRETIASIQQQTYKEFRLLVIDDGSSDGSTEYLHSIKDERFQIVRQENRGITAALNRTLADVQTPWLVRSDADDVSFPHRLTTIVKYIERFPKMGMFYSRAAHFQNGRVLGLLRTTEGDPQQIRRLVEAGFLPAINHSSVVFNVAKARALGGYRFISDVEADYDMFARMALANEMMFIPETLVGYRLNTGSVTMQEMHGNAIHLLYVQYLLISRLWGLSPEPFEKVESSLEQLIDRNILNYQAGLKRAVVSIGKREYGNALSAAMSACAHSPRLFASRILYQFGIHQSARVGENPKKFRAHHEQLWPNQDIQKRGPSKGQSSIREPL